MADNNVDMIKKALGQMAGRATPKVVSQSVKQITSQLSNYLDRLDNLYDRIGQSAKQKLDIYSAVDAGEITTSYALYKELKGYDIEATEMLKEGYILIDNFRQFFTNETIKYDVGFTYKGTLYEIEMTMEEILASTRAEYNTRSKINDLYKLRMSVRKGDLVKAYNETHNQVEKFDDGSSTIYSSIWRYINEHPSGKAVNKGNVYEAYKVYKAEVGSNRIPPAKFQADKFDDILTNVRKNTASSIKGGDYLNTQIKFISSAPSLMTTSTVRTTLRAVLNIFNNIENGVESSSIIQQVEDLFIKRADQVASGAEDQARLEAEEFLKDFMSTLTK